MTRGRLQALKRPAPGFHASMCMPDLQLFLASFFCGATLASFQSWINARNLPAPWAGHREVLHLLHLVLIELVVLGRGRGVGVEQVAGGWPSPAGPVSVRTREPPSVRTPLQSSRHALLPHTASAPCRIKGGTQRKGSEPQQPPTHLHGGSNLAREPLHGAWDDVVLRPQRGAKGSEVTETGVPVLAEQQQLLLQHLEGREQRGQQQL